MVAPLLGISKFGIYRAVSSAAAPVRVVLEAVRPLAARADHPQARRRVLVLATLLGLVSACAIAGGLLLVRGTPLGVGVIKDLTHYAAMTGAFTGTSVISALAYYLARVHAPPDRLWQGRLWQSGAALFFPLVGASFWGLEGAIVWYVGATAFGAVSWSYIVLKLPVAPGAALSSQTSGRGA